MSKSSIYNSYVDADFDPIPKSSTSSSSLSSSSTLHQQQQPTQSQQSSRSTARQRSSQAERWKQLQDLGQHIEEATTWSRRRAEFVTTTSSSRFRHNLDSKKNGNSPMTASSVDMEKTDSTLDDRQDSISGPSSKVNLREASLEGLEGLIAASAQRLVNYNLKKQSEQYINTISTDDTTCTKSTKGSYQQRQDYKGDNDFDSTSPTSATSSYNSLHKDTNTISSLSPPSDHHHQQQQQQQQQEKSIINNASPPIPSLSNTINSSTSKRISSHKKYLQRTLPASLSSHHQMVDKEKFSLVSPTSPSLSFRRSYQMTPPPAPIVTSTSRQKRPSKINTLHQQQPQNHLKLSTLFINLVRGFIENGADEGSYLCCFVCLIVLIVFFTFILTIGYPASFTEKHVTTTKTATLFHDFFNNNNIIIIIGWWTTDTYDINTWSVSIGINN
ncbi:hypothetical protein BC941DRAFT_448012 [Chlamydoabsidia padenii]|nr:hypothetical protein BC941DRAFT_448012 [Chlamydoabsidia padenii]